jgi:hypothetical protein
MLCFLRFTPNERVRYAIVVLELKKTYSQKEWAFVFHP